MSPPGRDLRCEDGSAATELVVATPALLLVLLLVVQFALWQHATHVAAAVAQHGLQGARLDNGTTTSGDAAAIQLADQLGRGVLVEPRIAVSRTPTTTTVTVSGSAEAVVPFLHLPVHVTFTAPTESFRQPGSP